MSDKIPMTREGYEKLKSRLDHLKTVKRREIDAGKISITSPIAQGLLGLKAGDTAQIRVPAGTLKCRILDITRT